MDQTTVDTTDAPAKKWYSLSPKTRELLVTVVVVGAVVYAVNKLSATPVDSIASVDTPTV